MRSALPALCFGVEGAWTEERRSGSWVSRPAGPTPGLRSPFPADWEEQCCRPTPGPLSQGQQKGEDRRVSEAELHVAPVKLVTCLVFHVAKIIPGWCGNIIGYSQEQGRVWTRVGLGRADTDSQDPTHQRASGSSNIYVSLCLSISVSIYLHACTRVWTSQEDLREAVSPTMWMLGLTLRSSGLAARVFAHGATSLAPEESLKAFPSHKLFTTLWGWGCMHVNVHSARCTYYTPDVSLAAGIQQ